MQRGLVFFQTLCAAVACNVKYVTQRNFEHYNLRLPGCFKPGRRMEDFEMVPKKLYQKNDLTRTFCFNFLIFKVDEMVSLCLKMFNILQARYIYISSTFSLLVG